MEVLGAVVADNLPTMSDGMRQYGEAGRDGIGVWQYPGNGLWRDI